MTNRNESTRPRAQRREVDNHEGGMRKRRPLNRAPVIRPEGPGCPRLRALTPSAPSAETIYRSWIKRATGEGRPPPGWFRFLRLQTTVDRLLTERTRQRLWRARHGRTRHVEAAEPGELVCLDTFYIGNLKGVGKVWQITACNAASSYGVAALLPAHTAVDAAGFLRDVLVPLFRRAGWPLRRVPTDGGPEVNRAFAEACRQLGLRHH